MRRKRIYSTLLSIFFIAYSVFCQEVQNLDTRFFIHGMVMDANTLSPIPNSQIWINRIFSSVSDKEGTFSFYANRSDSILFKSLGYKSTRLILNDTLSGREFIAGVYMNSDTVSIGEVVIIPRYRNLKSEILNDQSRVPSTFDNAKYNVAVSAYQGRNSQNKLGDPADNYSALRKKQAITAFERGGIPSDQMVQISSLLLLPAAYLLVKGIPEQPAPMEPMLTKQELDQLYKKYLETLKQRK